MIPSPLGWPAVSYLAYGDTFADHLKRGNGNYPYLGTDILMPEGFAVFAVHGGEVQKHYNDPDYGNFVDVIAPWGRTRYAHLQAINANVQDAIGQSGLLGWSGHTGRATGPHLHFELWDASLPAGGPYFQRVDPQLYLTRPGQGEAPATSPTGPEFATIGCAPVLAAFLFAVISIALGIMVALA